MPGRSTQSLDLMTSAVVQIYAAVVSALGVGATVGFAVGWKIPRIARRLGISSFVLVIGLWALMLVDSADGPGGALGLAMVGAASLFLLAVGVGLVSGAGKRISPLVGLGVGLALSGVVHLWWMPHAHPAVGAVILVTFSILGYIGPTRRVKASL